MFYFLKDVVYTRIIVILKTTFDYDVQFDCPLLLFLYNNDIYYLCAASSDFKRGISELLFRWQQCQILTRTILRYYISYLSHEMLRG